jgi:hypothetical protein
MRAGRVLLGTVAAVTAVGGFAADWNRTHLFNPAWPPHAKFHDAQTIVLGSLLGGAGLYFLSREGDTRRGATLAAALPGMFWAAQGGSFAFPGAEGLEAEFPELVPRLEGVWINERFAAGLMLGLGSLGYLLERRRLREPATATGRPDLPGPRDPG